MSEATYWRGKYGTLLQFYEEIVMALGFLDCAIDPAERHPEALARAHYYRHLVTSCNLDNPEEWDD